MKGLTITLASDTRVLVDFGDYANSLGVKKAAWNKSDIKFFKLKNDNSYIEVYMTTENQWQISCESFADPRVLYVQSVGESYPTTNQGLFDLLVEIL